VTARSRILVGRERELGLLDEILDHALNGVGGNAWIMGEAGIGKSRLLAEVAARANARGFALAWGRGWELGKAPSHWPWLEILRTLIARPAAPLTRAPRLFSLLPELNPEARARAEDGDAFQLYDAVHGYLRAHSQVEPLALFFDDLHAADPSSLELAEFVATGLAGCRIALFGSQSDVVDRERPELERRLSRLARRGERIVLGRLSQEHVATWLERATGDADPAAARRVHAASDGNPLFVSELLCLPALGRPLSAAELPGTLRALIRERSSPLSAGEAEQLGAAAIIGRTFALPLWAEVTGVEVSVLAGVAQEACRAGLLAPAERDSFRFSHALVAETLILELEPAARAALHRRVATALERRHESDPAAPLEAIAHHWLEAGGEAAPRALAAVERAARLALSRLAFADAALLYERAIGVLASSSPVDLRRQAELSVALVEALARADERERAERVCARAVELARALGDGALLARAALALGSETRIGDADQPVVRLLEQALAWLPSDDGALGALVRARLASARQPALDPELPMRLAREAIAMGRRLGDERLLLAVIHAGLGALMDFAPAEERAALNAEALELATRLGDRPRALSAAQRLAFDRLELLDLHGFELALLHYEALGAELGEPRYAWVPAMFRSMRAEWQGEFAQAERWEREARDAREQGRGEGARLVRARPLTRALLRADGALLERFVSEFQAEAPHAASAGLLGALLAAWQGRDADARQALDLFAARGLSHWIGREPAAGGAPPGAPGSSTRETDHGWGYILMPEVSVEIACRLADVRWAETLYRELEGSAGKPFLLTMTGFTLHGMIDHALMRLSAVGQRWADVERHAAAAIAGSERLRARPLLARVRHDAAAIWLRRARAATHPPERAALGRRALEFARGAELIARELGLEELAQCCRVLIGELEAAATEYTVAPNADPRGSEPGDAPRDAASAGALRLFCEGEYWTVSLGGEVCRVQDNRGMRMLAQLVDNPGRELHVLELSGSVAGVDRTDSGALLDARARAAYRERLRELRAELDEAADNNDLARQERLQTEAEILSRELARAFGLGGRERRGGSAVERARVNVRRRLTLALRRIRAASPALGDAIAAALRTGIHCVYTPLEGSRR
jgi:hypothetical protein